MGARRGTGEFRRSLLARCRRSKVQRLSREVGLRNAKFRPSGAFHVQFQEQEGIGSARREVAPEKSPAVSRDRASRGVGAVADARGRSRGSRSLAARCASRSRPDRLGRGMAASRGNGLRPAARQGWSAQQAPRSIRGLRTPQRSPTTIGGKTWNLAYSPVIRRDVEAGERSEIDIRAVVDHVNIESFTRRIRRCIENFKYREIATGMG
jgi:hypothetical protein